MGPVVAAPAQLQAGLGRRVAEQARQEQGHGSHAQVAGAAVGLGAGAGAVRVGVALVVVGAVVEDALDQAHAGAVLHHALGGAEALAVAGQAGRQGPGGRALATLALPALLANELVLAQVLLQGALQVVHQQLLGLGPHCPLRAVGRDRSGRRRPSQQPLLRRRAAVAPGAGGAPGAGRSAQDGASGVVGECCVSQVACGSLLVVVIHTDRYDFMSPLLLFLSGSRSRGGPFHHRGPFRVFVAASDGLDLVQGQNSSRRGLSVIVQPLPAGQGRLLGHDQ